MLDVTLVLIVKVFDVAPAGTTTDAGKVTSLGTPALRLTVQPPVPAAELIVTVPVTLPPAVTDVGLTETLTSELPLMVTVVLADDVGHVAYTPIVSVLEVAFVVIGNVTVEDPAGTRTEVGTVTRLGTAADRLTVQPPAGATACNVIVPVVLEPAAMLFGATPTLAILTERTLIVAEW